MKLLETAELRLTMGEDGTRIIDDALTKRSVCFAGGEEFVLQLSAGERDILLAASRMERTVQGGELRYAGEGVSVTVRYCAEREVVKKRVTVSADRPLLLKRVVLDNARSGLAARRGGEGQPLFLGDELWCGVEFPTARNDSREGALDFSECPFAELGEKPFACDPVAYGLRRADTLEESFCAYLERHAKKPPRNLRIYCDWGMHDELSDHLDLSEEKVHAAIDEIVALRERGVRLDYYLMDAFWFRPGAWYDELDPVKFPCGFAPVTAHMREAGLSFGLWFDVNFIHAHLDEPQLRRLPEVGGVCFDAAAKARMQEAIAARIREDGVKLLKFDFAYFDCENPAHASHSALLSESKEKGVRHFVEMLEALRREEPELVVLAYNGFTTRLDFIGSVEEHGGYACSPWWATLLDYVYCGDPRPSEIAAPSLAKSILFYTDAMVRDFQTSLFPLDQIDDHGTMVGNTGTIYWLGRETLRDSLILNILRGGGKFHLYGDLQLLDEGDKDYVAWAYRIYEEVRGRNMTTVTVGGNPALREPYGYVSSDGERGFAVLVNPAGEERDFTLACPEWRAGARVRGAVLCRSGVVGEEPFKIFRALTLPLAPEEVVTLSWTVSGSAPLGVCTTVDAGRTLECAVASPAAAVSFYHEDGSVWRTLRGLPEGVRITAGGRPAGISVQVDVWSGVSWVYVPEARGRLEVHNESKRPVRLRVEERT